MSNIVNGVSLRVLTDKSGDCSLNGISKRFKDVVLVDERINMTVDLEYFHSDQVVELKTINGNPHLRPKCIGDTTMNMFGGNWAWCSDSRFRGFMKDIFGYAAPIKIHDRVEAG